MIRQRADLTAYDASGQLVLVAEVKARRGTNAAWAASLRRNILAHGLLPLTPYFLLALPDRFYLWKDSPLDLVNATYEIDPTPLLQPYYTELDNQRQTFSGAGFELVVASLLTRLMSQDGESSVLKEQSEELAESGLLDALAGGRLEVEVPV